MDEQASFTRDVLTWLKVALPWAALGSGGGALRILDPEHRVTFRDSIWLLLRSTLVGAFTGVVITEYDFRLGSKVALVVFCAFGADTIIAIGTDLWARIRKDPWLLVRWVRRRGPGDAVPPGDGP